MHDLDAVKVEVHADIVITYGRYISLFMPAGRNAARGKLNSIWFERVYAERNGQWKFLSHRTVHGPRFHPLEWIPPPAGVESFSVRGSMHGSVGEIDPPAVALGIDLLVPNGPCFQPVTQTFRTALDGISAQGPPA